MRISTLMTGENIQLVVKISITPSEKDLRINFQITIKHGFKLTAIAVPPLKKYTAWTKHQDTVCNQ